MQAQQKKLTTTKGTWRYHVQNEGSHAIIFLHGANSSQNIWMNQHELFSDGYKNIYIDRLGYGISDKPTSGYGLKNWIQGINRIVQQENVDELILIGHSNGVIVANEYYRNFSKDVKGLILLDGMLKPLLAPETIAWMRSYLNEESYPSFIQNSIQYLPTSELDKAKIAILKEDALNTPLRVAQAELEMLNNETTWQKLKISVPTLIVHSNNPIWTTTYIEEIKSIASDHRLEKWEDSGHFLSMQHPERTNELISNFIKEISK